MKPTPRTLRSTRWSDDEWTFLDEAAEKGTLSRADLIRQGAIGKAESILDRPFATRVSKRKFKLTPAQRRTLRQVLVDVPFLAQIGLSEPRCSPRARSLSLTLKETRYLRKLVNQALTRKSMEQRVQAYIASQPAQTEAKAASNHVREENGVLRSVLESVPFITSNNWSS